MASSGVIGLILILVVDGLTAPVTVIRDDLGVPQLYADGLEDLFAAQGYVHAQDRFWEMDVHRHITAGRLSEMFGESQVTTDSFLRTFGWRRIAQDPRCLRVRRECLSRRASRR